MKTLTQTELLALTGAAKRDVENWMGRLPLVTKYEETIMGRARNFSRDNALEIALIDRLVKTGMSPAAAAKCVARLFKDIKAKKPHGFATFFTGGNMPIDYIVDDKPPPAAMLKLVKGAVMVNVAQLETEIDEFFEDDES
jgi:MerR HTH family regulatory protein